MDHDMYDGTCCALSVNSEQGTAGDDGVLVCLRALSLLLSFGGGRLEKRRWSVGPVFGL